MALKQKEQVAGVNVTQDTVNAGGISGLWGDQRGYNIYSSDPLKDPNYESNRALVAKQLSDAMNQRPEQMYTGDADQWRGQQRQMAEMLQAVVAGSGPSAAQEQLKAATGANNAAAASTAASTSQYGGNPAAAFKAALNQQAMNNQNAIGQSAQLRANEITAARGQLGQLMESSRGQDMSQAQSQMAAAIQQRAQQQAYVAQLMQMGYSEDQANYMAQIQQQQFQQGSLAQQEAAKQGVNTQNSAPAAALGAQVIGGAIGGIGSALGGGLAGAPVPKVG
jgi:hypothetical protein